MAQLLNMQAKRKPQAEPPATPDMIESAFAILHQQGWRPQHRSAFLAEPPTPAVRPKAKPPTRAQMAAARAYAEQMGWTPLSQPMADLLRIILRTNYRGRNIIGAVVKAIQRDHPWIDGDPANTEE